MPIREFSSAAPGLSQTGKLIGAPYDRAAGRPTGQCTDRLRNRMITHGECEEFSTAEIAARDRCLPAPESRGTLFIFQLAISEREREKDSPLSKANNILFSQAISPPRLDNDAARSSRIVSRIAAARSQEPELGGTGGPSPLRLTWYVSIRRQIRTFLSAVTLTIRYICGGDDVRYRCCNVRGSSSQQSFIDFTGD